MNPRVEVYTRPGCQQCEATKRWLHARGVAYVELDARGFRGEFERLGAKLHAPLVKLSDDVYWVGYRPDLLAAHLGDSPKSESAVHPLIGDILAAHRQAAPDDAA